MLRTGGQTQLSGDTVFFVQAQTKIKQTRLGGANQPRQRNRGAHIRQGVMRSFMHHAIGARQILQGETGFAGVRAIVFGGPDDALGPQRIRHAHDIEQIPAAAVVLPLAAIRVDQVAPEHEARHFIIKPNGVVAHANGAGLGQQLLDLRGKSVLRQAVLQAMLRRDAGNQAGSGIRQIVIGGLAVKHHRLADFVQLGIGANAGKLRRPVAPGIEPEGFIVVPEKSMRKHQKLTVKVKKAAPLHRAGA